MRTLRFVWQVLIPAVASVACFVASLAALVKGDQLHIPLVYFLGAVYHCDVATESLERWDP